MTPASLARCKSINSWPRVADTGLVVVPPPIDKPKQPVRKVITENETSIKAISFFIQSFLVCEFGNTSCHRVIEPRNLQIWRGIFYGSCVPFLVSQCAREDKNNMIYQREIEIQTTGHRHMHDLTQDVAMVVTDSNAGAGLVNIFNVGSTGAVGTIEFEPGLQEDLPAMLDKLFPPSRDYGHERAWHDGNGHSHLQATTLGTSIMVPIKYGKLVLGTWQQIFHLECDIKPRRKTVMVTMINS